MKPNFVHDCEECTFLGRMEESLIVQPDFVPSDEAWESVYSTDVKRDIDLYYCNKGDHPTVIARFSDEGPDYVSGLAFAEPPPPELGIAPVSYLLAAKNLATAKGLIK